MNIIFKHLHHNNKDYLPVKLNGEYYPTAYEVADKLLMAKTYNGRSHEGTESSGKQHHLILNPEKK